VSQLHHSNIVNVFDIFEENGTAYFVMDYIAGRSLSDIVNHDGPLPEARALKYIRQIASALQYVHDHNRLHLNIKPSKIMVDSDDNAILIDFGTSKLYDEESGENTSNLMEKTLVYTPLEQMGNDVIKFTPATDIYSLGATLYNLLTGITPLPASRLASGEELDPLPDSVSDSTALAITAAMTINKMKRPQSMTAFLALLDGEVPAAEEKRFPDQQSSSPIKEPWKKMLGWAVAVVVLFGIVVAFGYSRQSGSSKTFTVNGITFKMMKVEGGTFSMGATSEQEDPDDDEMPVHQVTLYNYYIGETEVTQALWTAVMGGNPSCFTGDNRPVEQVSWNDCQEFIKKLNSLTGENFRLPTEAEWEFAARGGHNSQGYQYSGSNNLSSVAWYYDNSGNQTHEVKTKSPNELGIYDMSGNVWEWCQDWYGYYSSSSVMNPMGAASGSSRVCRGGCWNFNAGCCRSAYRGSNEPSDQFCTLGLRLVL
jgi:formylglycine-generating enzyme required for sulfatase activity